MFPLDIYPKRFIACTAIGHWFSGCYNTLRIRKIKLIEEINKEYYEIRKEYNLTNPEDLSEYIQPSPTYLTRRNLEKLLKR